MMVGSCYGWVLLWLGPAMDGSYEGYLRLWGGQNGCSFGVAKDIGLAAAVSSSRRSRTNFSEKCQLHALQFHVVPNAFKVDEIKTKQFQCLI